MKGDVVKIATNEVRSEDLINIYTNIYKYFNYYYIIDKTTIASGTIANRTTTIIYRITNLNFNLVTIKSF